MSDDGGITSPEGVLMLMVAVVFDGLSIIITIIGMWFVFPLVIDLILDILPIIMIGGWALIRGLWSGDKGIQEVKEYAQEVSSKISSAKKSSAKTASKTAVKTGAKSGFRFGLTTIGELIPILGALPIWTWFVYKEMGGMSISSASQEESGSDEEGEKVVPASIASGGENAKEAKQESPKTSA